MGNEHENKIEGLELLEPGSEGSWRRSLSVHKNFQPNMKACLAIQIVERWGCVAGTPDGEDSAGRSIVRLQTVDELIERACSTADLLIEELNRRDWLLYIPAPKVVKEE